MAKITEYPQATKLDTGDVLLKDGTGGTKKMLAKDLAKELAPDVLGDIPGRVDDLESAVEELSPVKDINSTDLWEQGGIASGSGGNQASTTNTYSQRIRTTGTIPDNVSKIVNKNPNNFGYLIVVYSNKAWSSSNYIGMYDSSGAVVDESPKWITGDTDISDVEAAARIAPKTPATATAFYYRLEVANSAPNSGYRTDTAPSDCINLKLMAEVEETIEVDNTLTVEGMAADAKAAGDRIRVLEGASEVKNLNASSLWEDGGYLASNAGTNNIDVRIRTQKAIPSRITRIVNTDPTNYQYLIYVFDGYGASKASYLGIYQPSGSLVKTGASWATGDTDISDVISVADNSGLGHTGEYSFKIVLRLASNTDITAAEGEVLQFIGTADRFGERMEGIPVLYLSSVTQEEAGEGANVNVDEMTKDEKITMRCSIFGKSDLCTVKWQGSSSIRYEKKNYTLSLKSTAMDAYKEWLKWLWDYRDGLGISMNENTMPEFAGITDENTAWWGNQKKFCMKANYIDPSMARNIVSARLWAQMVKSRVDAGDITDGRASAPKQGAIDGFPIEIRIDGESIGLYTFNIPKDEWAFDMGGENAGDEYLIGGESNNYNQTKFRSELGNVEEYDAGKTYAVGALTVHDGSLYRYSPATTTNPTTGEWTGAGWVKLMDVEYMSDGKTAVDALTSLNVVISKVVPLVTATPGTNPESANWETTLAPYLDIQSVYDYFIFTCCIGNNDALAKNILYGNYDAKESDTDIAHDGKWFMTAYDMDTTYGNDPYGTARWTAQGVRTNFAGAADVHGLAWLVYHFGKEHLVERYKQLREGYFDENKVWHEAILSDANVWHEFSWFVTNIPERDYAIEQEIWPNLPGTATADITNFMQYYHNHCAYLDKEIAEIEKEA